MIARRVTVYTLGIGFEQSTYICTNENVCLYDRQYFNAFIATYMQKYLAFKITE